MLLHPCRDCRVVDWKARHKQECGKSLIETANPPEAPSGGDFLPEFDISWLRQFPFAVWGCSYQDALDDQPGKYGEMKKQLYDLPSFVRPYLATLDKLIELRNRALRKRNDFDIGLLALYVRKFLLTQPGFNEQNVNDQPYLGLLAGGLGLEKVDLLRKAATAQDKIDRGKTKVEPLVLFCFKQLENRAPESVSLPPFLRDLPACPNLLSVSFFLL